jgi:hypothetical protein
MSRIPEFPYSSQSRWRRSRNLPEVVKPAGHFTRESSLRVMSDRSPESVTKINPESMKTILPEMIYIPPA